MQTFLYSSFHSDGRMHPLFRLWIKWFIGLPTNKSIFFVAAYLRYKSVFAMTLIAKIVLWLVWKPEEQSWRWESLLQALLRFLITLLAFSLSSEVSPEASPSPHKQAKRAQSVSPRNLLLGSLSLGAGAAVLVPGCCHLSGGSPGPRNAGPDSRHSTVSRRGTSSWYHGSKWVCFYHRILAKQKSNPLIFMFLHLSLIYCCKGLWGVILDVVTVILLKQLHWNSLGHSLHYQILFPTSVL